MPRAKKAKKVTKRKAKPSKGKGKKRAKTAKKATKRRRKYTHKKPRVLSNAQKEVMKKFMKPQPLTPALEAVVGQGPLPRTEVTKNLWKYIKRRNLQDEKNRRVIKPDEKLAKVLGKAPVNMFKMTQLVSKQIGKT